MWVARGEDIEHKHLFSDERETERMRERASERGGLWSHLNKSSIFKKEFDRPPPPHPRYAPTPLNNGGVFPSPFTANHQPVGAARVSLGACGCCCECVHGVI